MITTEAIILSVNMLGLYFGVVVCRTTPHEASFWLGFVAVVANLIALVVNTIVWLRLP